jgi:hypothetical protein
MVFIVATTFVRHVIIVIFVPRLRQSVIVRADRGEKTQGTRERGGI